MPESGRVRFTIPSTVALAPSLIGWFLIVHVRRANGQVVWSRAQFLARTAFVVYIAAMVAITLFPIHVHTGEALQSAQFRRSVSIVPFDQFEIVDFILNIIMTVPLGIALVVFWPRLASVPLGLVIGYALGAVIELLQLLGRVTVANDRFVTINDVLANAIGVAVGVGVFQTIVRHRDLAAQLADLRAERRESPC
jgi:glycopeptide antibiotics resistance protein